MRMGIFSGPVNEGPVDDIVDGARRAEKGRSDTFGVTDFADPGERTATRAARRELL